MECQVTDYFWQRGANELYEALVDNAKAFKRKWSLSEWFPVAKEKADDCLDILNSMFFKSIFLRSEKFQMYRSSPEGSGGPFVSAAILILIEKR